MNKVLLLIIFICLLSLKSNANEFTLMCKVNSYKVDGKTHLLEEEAGYVQFIFNNEIKRIERMHPKTNEVIWQYNGYDYSNKFITLKNIFIDDHYVDIYFNFVNNIVIEERLGVTLYFDCKNLQELASLLEGNSISTEDLNTVVAASSGTGFFVSTNGHMVTNNHVIESCDTVKAHYKGRELDANILFVDRANDLAIIKANIKPNKVFAVSDEDVSLLEDIIVAGYPLGKNISASIKTFKGSVTALAGYGDNFSNFQIDASLSSGNSGGPIINQKGNVVGVAVEKLIEVGVEGFNFGVKSSTLKTFASSNQFKFQDPSTEELSNKELGQLITEATIYLECWMSVAKIKQIIEEGERQKAFFSEYK